MFPPFLLQPTFTVNMRTCNDECQKGHQRVSILKKTTGLCPFKCYYAMADKHLNKLTEWHEMFNYICCGGDLLTRLMNEVDSPFVQLFLEWIDTPDEAGSPVDSPNEWGRLTFVELFLEWKDSPDDEGSPSTVLNFWMRPILEGIESHPINETGPPYVALILGCIDSANEKGCFTYCRTHPWFNRLTQWKRLLHILQNFSLNEKTWPINETDSPFVKLLLEWIDSANEWGKHTD